MPPAARRRQARPHRALQAPARLTARPSSIAPPEFVGAGGSTRQPAPFTSSVSRSGLPLLVRPPCCRGALARAQPCVHCPSGAPQPHLCRRTAPSPAGHVTVEPVPYSTPPPSYDATRAALAVSANGGSAGLRVRAAPGLPAALKPLPAAAYRWRGAVRTRRRAPETAATLPRGVHYSTTPQVYGEAGGSSNRTVFAAYTSTAAEYPLVLVRPDSVQQTRTLIFAALSPDADGSALYVSLPEEARGCCCRCARVHTPPPLAVAWPAACAAPDDPALPRSPHAVLLPCAGCGQGGRAHNGGARGQRRRGTEPVRCWQDCRVRAADGACQQRARRPDEPRPAGACCCCCCWRCGRRARHGLRCAAPDGERC